MKTTSEHDHASLVPNATPEIELSDPVCGMSVTPDSPHRNERRGVTKLFEVRIAS